MQFGFRAAQLSLQSVSDQEKTKEENEILFSSPLTLLVVR